MQQLQAMKQLLGTSLVPGAELEDENPAVGPVLCLAVNPYQNYGRAQN